MVVGLLLVLVDEFITAKVIIQRLTEVIDATLEDENDLKKLSAAISGHANIF